MKVKDITQVIEAIAPLSYQESYDNVGLIIGDSEMVVNALVICLDVTEAVIQEAVELGANMILAHHPIVFSGLKRFNGRSYVERCVIQAIKNDVAIYAAHTNLDSVLHNGVNSKICQKLGLTNQRMLVEKTGELKKLVTFVPVAQSEQVRDALFNAGAGHIGKYDKCSFNASGQGSFRGLEGANPFVGQAGELHMEQEVRIETVFPAHKKTAVVSELKRSHPYEEVAYDIYPLENTYSKAGIGMLGELGKPEDELAFMQRLKDVFKVPVVKHTCFLGKPIKRVAVCGGSGSQFLRNALSARADVFVSADFKYHQYFDAEDKIVIADIGHFESEQFTKELFCDILTEKFPNFVIHLSKINTNPINYL